VDQPDFPQKISLHSFEIVFKGETLRLESSDAASALKSIHSDEFLQISDNPNLYQYVIRNNYQSPQGDIYRLVNGERIYNPIRVGGYALLTYTTLFGNSKSSCLCLVLSIEDALTWVIRAEGHFIGEEIVLRLNQDDGYNLEPYGGTLCDMTVPQSALDLARNQLAAQYGKNK
jgi:hypothetical protein